MASFKQQCTGSAQLFQTALDQLDYEENIDAN